MQLAALIFGHAFHHLDHLAPLCHFLNIPLVVTDPSVKEMATFFYPGLEIYEMTPIEMSSQVVEHCDALISCLSRPLLDPLFLVAEEMHHKKLITIWCPHGNSDKGHLSPLMEGLQDERLILVYGQKMVDFIRAKNGKVPDHLFVGNYRLHHYLYFKPFYDEWIKKALPPERTFLYAPTWDDAEGSSSLISSFPFLKEVAPHLFIKLHPNTLLQSPHLVEKLISQHEEFFFLPTYAPIYPLLERAQAYLGDMSSIGYDYLSFNRPMFFFNQKGRSDKDQGLYLHRCGETIPSSLLNLQGDLHEMRKEVYEYTFSQVDPKTLKSQLLRRIQGL
jgi:hypothetical protein